MDVDGCLIPTASKNERQDAGIESVSWRSFVQLWLAVQLWL